MKMEVLMGVDVIEPEPGSAKRLELSLDLLVQLIAYGSRASEIDGQSDSIVPQSSVGTDEIRNATPAKDRIALQQRQVQTDAQTWQAPRPRNGIRRRGGADHQTRRTKDSVHVCNLDGLVDLGCHPKVIRCDDEAPSHDLRPSADATDRGIAAADAAISTAL